MFWLFVCVCGGGIAFRRVFASIRSAYHLAGPSADQASPSPELCDLLSKQCRRIGKGAAFLRVFEQGWPALHVTVSLALLLGTGPGAFFFLFSTSPIHLLHLHLRMAPCCQCSENRDFCPCQKAASGVFTPGRDLRHVSPSARDLSILSSTLSRLKM